MSAHYYDTGSGPHDTEPRADGKRNCGCSHDGLRWLDLCVAARREWQLTHAAAALEHARAVELASFDHCEGVCEA